MLGLVSTRTTLRSWFSQAPSVRARIGAAAFLCLVTGPAIDHAWAQQPRPTAGPAAPAQGERPEPRELSVALDRALSQGEHLGAALNPVPDRIIRDRANADKLLQLLERWDLPTALARPEGTSQLAITIGLLSNSFGDEVIAYLRQGSRAKLLQFADALIENPKVEDHRDLLFVLQWLALTGGDEGAKRVLAAATKGIGTDEPLWPIVFDPFSHDSPTSRRVIQTLSDPLPAGMIGLGLLECANGLALSGVEFPHPFDSDAGVEKLREWLSQKDEASASNAQSAAAAIPFVKHEKRNELLQLAVDHPHPLVKAEAGWALVMMDDRRGIRLLQAVCKDVRYSVTAQVYLEELEAADQIPAECKVPEFSFRAELAHYLSLPDQLGEPPTEITHVGSQVLYWPPTKDRRELAVLKFKYVDSDGKTTREGIAMIGGLSVWLPNLTNIEMTGADVLGIHCCFELRMQGDPKAPEKIEAATGMAIIREAQRNAPRQ